MVGRRSRPFVGLLQLLLDRAVLRIRFRGVPSIQLRFPRYRSPRASSSSSFSSSSSVDTVRNDLNPLVNWIRTRGRSEEGRTEEEEEEERKKKKKKRTLLIDEMIPDTESVCQTSEAAVRSTDVYQKIKNTPEGEAASVTAWKRYQQLVAIVESRGGKFNRKSMIEAIFRGNDLVYASH